MAVDNQDEKITRIAIGHSPTADAFKSGRDAAEDARAQMGPSEFDLALAVGRNHATFKDFIEGVRLSVGENALIGLPTPWVRSSSGAGEGIVVLVRGQAQRLTLASAVEKENPLRGVTSIMTELRRRRGNSRIDFSFHGLVLFDCGLTVDKPLFAHLMAAEAGLESWMAGFGLWGQGATQICGARSIPSGISAIECLAEDPWGLGWVDTSAFPVRHAIRQEASRSAVREAIAQLGTQRPAVAFVFFATTDKPADPEAAEEALKSLAAAHPELPVIALPVRSPYVRVPAGIVTLPPEAVVALVLPE